MKIKRANGMPMWAKFITRDNNGDVWIWEHPPEWVRHEFQHADKGTGGRAAHIRWPIKAPSVGQVFEIKD